MLLEKNTFPEEDSIVLVTVTKVNPNSVFTVLDHYGKRTGLIHISEVSPGRIRNIREYVVEGKKVICKVLRVDKEKGHIDLSLRRVTEIQRRDLNDRIKQEQKSEKMLTTFAKEHKLSEKDIKAWVVTIGKHYDLVQDFFEELVEEQTTAEEILGKGKFVNELATYVKERRKPASVVIEGQCKLMLFTPNGAATLTTCFKEQADKQTTIKYLGGGLYHFAIAAKEYKQAEKHLKKKIEALEAFADKHKGVFSFERA